MLVAVRKLMDKIFTKYELEVLDDLMPETVKKQLEESVVESASDSDSDGCQVMLRYPNGPSNAETFKHLPHSSALYPVRELAMRH